MGPTLPGEDEADAPTVNITLAEAGIANAAGNKGSDGVEGLDHLVLAQPPPVTTIVEEATDPASLEVENQMLREANAKIAAQHEEMRRAISALMREKEELSARAVRSAHEAALLKMHVDEGEAWARQLEAQVEASTRNVAALQEAHAAQLRKVERQASAPPLQSSTSLEYPALAAVAAAAAAARVSKTKDAIADNSQGASCSTAPGSTATAPGPGISKEDSVGDEKMLERSLGSTSTAGFSTPAAPSQGHGLPSPRLAHDVGPQIGAVRRQVSPRVFLGASPTTARKARSSSTVLRSPCAVQSPRLKPREFSRGELSRAESHRAINSEGWLSTLSGDISGSLKVQAGSLQGKSPSSASDLSTAASSLATGASVRIHSSGAQSGASLLASASTGTSAASSSATGWRAVAPVVPPLQLQSCHVPASAAVSPARLGSPSRCVRRSALTPGGHPAAWLGSVPIVMSARRGGSPSPDARSRRAITIRHGRPAPPSPAVKSRPQQHLHVMRANSASNSSVTGASSGLGHETIVPSSRGVQATNAAATTADSNFLYTPRQRSVAKIQPLSASASAPAGPPVTSLPPASVYVPQNVPQTTPVPKDLAGVCYPDTTKRH